MDALGDWELVEDCDYDARGAALAVLVELPKRANVIWRSAKFVYKHKYNIYCALKLYGRMKLIAKIVYILSIYIRIKSLVII